MGCLLKPVFNIIKLILMIIGLITVIAAIVIGVAVWQLTKTPSIEAEMHPVEATVEDGYLFNQKLQDIEDKILSGQILPGEAVEVRLSEREVAGKIELAIEESAGEGFGLNVEDVWVNFRVDPETGAKQALILAKVKMGLTLKAGVVFELDIQGGEPSLTVDEIAVGSGWLLPQSAKDQIAKVIPSDDALKNAFKALPVSWSNLSIDETAQPYPEMVLTGQAMG